MKQRIKEAILSILEAKKQDGDVLPYATSIEVAHLLKMKAVEVERWTTGIEGIERGKTSNHEFYYVGVFVIKNNENELRG